MVKNKKKKDRKLSDIPVVLTFAPIIPTPEVHPNEIQEDPINGKYELSIENDEDRGIGWR